MPAAPQPARPPQSIEERTALYLRLIESNLQGRLVVTVKKVRDQLSRFLGQPVVLLTPPFAGTQVPGEFVWRFLNGEKTFAGAEDKVLEQYDGDWERAKDLSRCTLVVPRAQETRPAWSFVADCFKKNKFHDPLAVNDFMYHSQKEIDPVPDPCGYSGYTVFVQSKGLISEIQINSVIMMYAKSKNEFLKAFGQDRAKEIFNDYPAVPGFVGHELYEIARKTGANPAYAAACKLYYNYFRTVPADFDAGLKAAKALKDLGIAQEESAATPAAAAAATPAGPAPGVPPTWLAQSQHFWGRR